MNTPTPNTFRWQPDCPPSFAQVVHGAHPNCAVGRVLITSDNPSRDGYDAFCIECFAAWGAEGFTPHDYDRAIRWADTHHCEPDQRAFITEFLSHRRHLIPAFWRALLDDPTTARGGDQA